MARPSKLTDEQKQTIRELHDTLGVPYKDLALQYKVHYNTILRICDPEAYAKHLATAKEYQKVNVKQIAAQRTASQRRYVCIFSTRDDEELIEHMDAQENVSKYLRGLVTQDMLAAQKADTEAKD